MVNYVLIYELQSWKITFNKLNKQSNLTNKYNPQEQVACVPFMSNRSNLTNKYNPQEPCFLPTLSTHGSNLTNKYNPQEHNVKRKRG